MIATALDTCRDVPANATSADFTGAQSYNAPCARVTVKTYCCFAVSEPAGMPSCARLLAAFHSEGLQPAEATHDQLNDGTLVRLSGSNDCDASSVSA